MHKKKRLRNASGWILHKKILLCGIWNSSYKFVKLGKFSKLFCINKYTNVFIEEENIIAQA